MIGRSYEVTMITTTEQTEIFVANEDNLEAAIKAEKKRHEKISQAERSYNDDHHTKLQFFIRELED